MWDAPGMQRIKIPGGGLNADQLETMADLAEEYSDGIAHVTTRQDFQLHYVHIDDTPSADAPPGGREHHHARSLRKFRAQRHGLPLCRRLPGRSFRRHALFAGAGANSCWAIPIARISAENSSRRSAAARSTPAA